MISSFLKKCRAAGVNRMALIVILLLPAAVNILLGLEFLNGQIRSIPMAVVDQDNSSLSRMIVRQFEENETFDVKYYLKSGDEVKALLDRGDVKVGMVIPRDFSKDVAGFRSPGILMLYDGSHMSVASTAKTRATEILMSLKTGTAMKMMSGKLNMPGTVAEKTAQTIEFSNRVLYNPTKSFMYFLNPGLGVAVVQTGIVLMGVVSVGRESLTGNLAASLRYVSRKILSYGLLGTLSLMSSVFIQNKLFGIPFRGNYGSAWLLSLCLAFSVSVFSVMLSVWIPDSMIASTVGAVLFIPDAVLVGYTWPVLSMPAAYRFAASLIPFGHYADNLRDLYLKGVPLPALFNDIRWFCLFALVSLAALGMGLARRSRPVCGRAAAYEKGA
ncbi:MAG: ABC transporter permease [Clostridiales bacterium]|jgi:ABC-2 type transport system permease protein|nr:ABC transporter permease [Eubacteriales bacterium]MDH7567242.1 ABC transporter permease [Clostridiales bacterium]